MFGYTAFAIVIFGKSTTKTMYIWFYVINLWSQNQFLIDVARSLCEIVDVTSESCGLSGICMSSTLAALGFLPEESAIWSPSTFILACIFSPQVSPCVV